MVASYGYYTIHLTSIDQHVICIKLCRVLDKKYEWQLKTASPLPSHIIDDLSINERKGSMIWNKMYYNNNK